MSKVDYERSPDGYQRLLEANIRITKAFGLPHYDATTNPGINDNFNEGGYIRYNDSVSPVIELYNGSTWSSIGADPIGPAGGDLTGTYPNPTINTINSITKSYYDPTSSIQTQINGKQATITTGSTTQYFRGDLSLATFPLALPPNGTAGGDLTGTYPNPTVNTINSITKSYYDPTSSIQTQLNSKQATLVSGTNIKTINSGTMLGSGNILLQTPLVAGSDYLTPSTASSTYQTLAHLETTLTNSTTSYPSGSAVTTAISTAVSGLTYSYLNGINLASGIVGLGGTLDQTTNINLDIYKLQASSGLVGLTLDIPNGEAVLSGGDLGSSAYGILSMDKFNAILQYQKDGTSGVTSLSMTSTTQGINIYDTINSFGLSYYADYSSAGLLNGRWIPDIAAVYTAITAATSGFASAYDNGLTSFGTLVELGGALVTDTTIDTTGFVFTAGSSLNGLIINDPANLSVLQAYDSIAGTGSDIAISSNGAEFNYYGTSSNNRLVLNQFGVTVVDNTFLLGVQNDGDYSANIATNPQALAQFNNITQYSFPLDLTSNTAVIFNGYQLSLGAVNNGLFVDDTASSSQLYASGLLTSNSSVTIWDGTDVNAGLYVFNTSVRLFNNSNSLGQQQIELAGSSLFFPYINVTDDINLTGFAYNADYSTIGITNPLWIPSYGAIGDNFMPLALLHDTDIFLNGYALNIGIGNNSLTINDTTNVANLFASDGGANYTSILGTPTALSLYWSNTLGIQSLIFNGDMTVTDYAGFGLSNAADYSTNGTSNPLWLAQWGTVSSTFAPLLSPSLTTPTLGVASATSINKVTITTPASSATLTILNGKTFTSNNTLTLAGTDSSTLNIGTGGTLGTAAYTSSSSYLTTISGISASGELSGTYPSPSLSNSAVIGKVLTGYTSGSGTILSTDSILQAIQKLNGNIAGLTTGVSTFNTRSGAITLTLTDVNSVSATTLGTVSTGVWQGTLIGSTYGGTGVNNGSSTITIGGNVTYSGAFTTTIAVSGNTSVTLPTSGALYGTATGSITSAQMLASLSDETGTGALVFGTSPSLTTPALGTPSALVLTNATGLTSGQVTTALTFTPLNVAATTLPSSFLASSLTSIGIISTGTWQGTLLAGQYGGTGVANTGKTITLGGNFGTSGAFSTTLTVGASTNVTLPSTGTLSTLAGTESLTNKTINGNTITSGTGTLGLSNSVSYTIKGIGNTTLVSGTKAISITGVTTSSIAFVQLVSQGGTSTTVYAYKIVCTSGTITITAETVAGAAVTTDTSNVNYVVYN